MGIIKEEENKTFIDCLLVEKELLLTKLQKIDELLKTYSAYKLYSNDKFRELTLFNFSMRTIKLLHRFEVFTIKDLCLHTEDDLMRYQGCGIAIIEDIKKVLKDKGLQLKKTIIYAINFHRTTPRLRISKKS